MPSNSCGLAYPVQKVLSNLFNWLNSAKENIKRLFPLYPPPPPPTTHPFSASFQFVFLFRAFLCPKFPSRHFRTSNRSKRKMIRSVAQRMPPAITARSKLYNSITFKFLASAKSSGNFPPFCSRKRMYLVSFSRAVNG